MGFLTFLATPAGIALANVAPQLVADVIATLHKSGQLTAQDIADHYAIEVPEIADQPGSTAPGGSGPVVPQVPPGSPPQPGPGNPLSGQ